LDKGDRRRTENRFILALALTAVILVAEVAGGLWTGSLSLLSDAAHILLDLLALGLSYAALRIAARPADDRHTYGFHRWQVVAALANGATLSIVAFWIFREAWLRFREPVAVLAGPMLAIAVLGLIVNLTVALVLREHRHDDLNVRSAYLHVLGDALSSVGVIVAGVIILFTGWTLADPLVSALIGVIILVSSGRVLRESLHILVEGTPQGLATGQVCEAMSGVTGVAGVHDLHIWSVTSGYVALSAHVVLADSSLNRAPEIQDDLRRMLGDRFGIQHITVQLESAHCGQGVLSCAGGH